MSSQTQTPTEQTSNPEINTPSKPSSIPKPTLTKSLGFVALQRTRLESVGSGERKQARQIARLIPIVVRSIAVAVEANPSIVPLAAEITLTLDETVVDVAFRPVQGAEIRLPSRGESEDSELGLEFLPTKIAAFGVVRTDSGKLALVDVDGELELPVGYELVGAMTAPVGTHALDVWDDRTGEGYRLGYSFPNTAQPAWIELALERREKVWAGRAVEHRERELERRAELEAELERKRAATANPKPTPKFQTSDIEVVRRIRASYGYLTITVEAAGSGESLRYFVEDPEERGSDIAAVVADEREEFARQGVDADKEYERRRG